MARSQPNSKSSCHDPVAAPAQLQERFLLAMRMRNCTARTIEQWRFTLGRFNTWCVDRGIESVAEVTPAILAAYRRYLFHYRNPRTGRALKYSTQTSYLISVRGWFRWLAKEKLLPEDVARDLDLPKEERRLPGQVLTVDQVESMLNATNVTTDLGLRDRAMLETLYSTAIRCSELVALDVYDLEGERGVLRILRGKGHKDRFVPIGQRALTWLERYLREVRPLLVARTNETALFVSCQGKRFCRTNVSALVRTYLDRAGIATRGSCHLLRHTAATLMLENGADLRSLQLYLGHEHLNTTQIYTHVSIDRLKEVHAKTHPARPRDSPLNLNP